MTEIVLYYRPTCGYCRKVISFMEANGISIGTKNILESSDLRNELIEVSGKAQVPCLVIDGEPMHESEDIINWLKEHFKK